MSGWAVELEGVLLSGTNAVSGIGSLSVPPDGLGAPPLRTEDVTYAQRDGVRHFNDWYEPRIITLEGVWVCPDGCPACPSAREKVQQIASAWSRKCDDVELVIFTDCDGEDNGEVGYGFGEGPFGEGPFGGGEGGGDGAPRSVVGPFGIVGRPRVAELSWVGQGSKCAAMTLRFDAVDHRMFVLDAGGEPGSGTTCLTLMPDSSSRCRTYPHCYPSCYTVEESTGSGPVSGTVFGGLCVNPTITLTGGLTTPTIENVTTGESLTYLGSIAAGAEPVIIDTSNGTASQGGQSRTHLLSGDTRMTLDVGVVTLRLVSQNSSDDGQATVCWRPAVLAG